MQIIPVLDLMNSVVVRGIAGRRREYRPIHSQLTSSCRPLEVAKALFERYGLSELYVADLDAIAGAAPAVNVYDALREHGFRLWVDAGIRSLERASRIAASGIEGIVVGLETINHPETLEGLCIRYGGERIVFSLDLHNGTPIGRLAAWSEAHAAPIATEAIARGVKAVIVLDLSQVGMSAGTGTETLCHYLAAAHPSVKIVAGGGIRNFADLVRMQEIGVRAVLIASALHDGSITPRDVAALTDMVTEPENMASPIAELLP